MTREPEPRALTASRSSGSTSTPERRTYSGWTPAAAAASTRSSPSAAKRPSRSRPLFSWSRRICLSLSLCGEVIKWEVVSRNEKGRLDGRPGSRLCGYLRSGSRRLPGALGKASEGLGVADGDVGQHLAIELDLGQAQPVHELAVAHALAPGGRVDAGDSQAPEVALA